MSIDAILDRLDGVKKTGKGWIACCPSHDDRHRSLSVRETDDGTILVHCFADCSAYEVVSTVGLDLADLFPPRRDEVHAGKPQRRPFPAADVLRCVGFEALVVAVAASRLGQGEIIDANDRERLLLAASRIQAAVRESGYDR